jgi:hypothetical protein
VMIFAHLRAGVHLARAEREPGRSAELLADG